MNITPTIYCDKDGTPLAFGAATKGSTVYVRLHGKLVPGVVKETNPLSVEAACCMSSDLAAPSPAPLKKSRKNA